MSARSARSVSACKFGRNHHDQKEGEEGEHERDWKREENKKLSELRYFNYVVSEWRFLIRHLKRAVEDIV